MMGGKTGQPDSDGDIIDSIIPQNHLLRQIKNCVNFDFIYTEEGHQKCSGRMSLICSRIKPEKAGSSLRLMVFIANVPNEWYTRSGYRVRRIPWI